MSKTEEEIKKELKQETERYEKEGGSKFTYEENDVNIIYPEDIRENENK